ncbi:MAG: PilZ domain-containing protein [Thermodesulfobacteriota bacterium]
MEQEHHDPYAEKRKYPRKPCLISVECGLKDSVFTNHIQNISRDGVYIETTAPFSVGQEITLRILAPYKLNQIKNIVGEIVRVEPLGIAVRFKKDDPVQEALIRVFVENI